MTAIQTNGSISLGGLRARGSCDLRRDGSFPHDRREQSVDPTTSDQELVQRVANGDRLAMQVLYARHHVRVYRFALRQVDNAAVAEDVTSEVFLELWRQAGRFEQRSAVSTWLLAIARFKALAALRRGRRAPFDGEEMVAAIEDPSDGPDVTANKKERSAIIRECVTRLSPKHQQIIDLVYYHEKSVQEVAQIVKIPPDTVKTRMFCARRKLAKLLKSKGIVDSGT